MIKCPYCGKELDLKVIFSSETPSQLQPKEKWYFATYWFVIALLCIGPFALPLMWFNPRYKLITKIILSVAIIALSAWFYIEIKAALNMARQQLGGLYNGKF